MTVRQGKQLILLTVGILIAAAAVGVWASIRNGSGLSGASGLPGLILLGVVTLTSWTRLKKLEAEHGPDYVPPTSKNSRTVLLIAVAFAIVLAAIAIWLVAR